MSFGELFKSIRIRSGKTLRTFCEENSLDPGNVSRLERGKIAAPESEDSVRRYGLMLGLAEDSEEMQELVDTAAAERGQIPQDLLDDAELVDKLPVLFRSLRSNGGNDDLRRLAEDVRRL